MSENLKKKLTSRKLWMAVANLMIAIVIFFTANPDTAERIGAIILMIADVLAYCIGEGLADANTIIYMEERGKE